MATQLISRDFHGATIRQRPGDGYLDATAMCKATGKLFKDYRRLKTTQEYLEVFSLKRSIPTSRIIEIKPGRYGGSWIHPEMLNHFTTWVNQTPSAQPEKTIQSRLQSELGGKIEVKTPAGTIDLLTDNKIIEIKMVKSWKAALGQVLIYGEYYPNHLKRIHLFGKISNGDLTIATIEKHYAKFDVTLTIEG